MSMDGAQSSFDVAVTVCSAVGLAKKDVFGLSDPYVKVVLIQNGEVAWKERTPTVEKSLNPKWNKMYILRVDGSHAEDSKIIFNVYDANRLTRDDFLGRVEIPVKSIPTRSGSDAVEQRFELQQRTYKSRVAGYLSLIVFRVPEGASRNSDDAVWRPSRSSLSTPEQNSPALGSRTPQGAAGAALVAGVQAATTAQQPLTGWHRDSRREQPLPDNWEERIDNLGRRFYVNHVSRTIQWERPVSEEQPPSALSDNQRRQDAALMYRRRHHASQDYSEQEQEQQQQQVPSGQRQGQQEQQLQRQQQPTTIESAERTAAGMSAVMQAQASSLLAPSAPPIEEAEDIDVADLLAEISHAEAQARGSTRATIDANAVPSRTVASAPAAAVPMTTTSTSTRSTAAPASGAAAPSSSSGTSAPPAALAALPAAPTVAVTSSPYEAPLPSGWVQMLTPGGRVFFIDHNTKTTTWNDPRLSATPEAPKPAPKPASVQRRSLLTSNDPTQHLGPLPSGWEELVHNNGRKFYIDHNTKTTQWEDPRLTKLRGAAVEYSITYKKKYQQFRSRLAKPEGVPQKFEMKIGRSNILEDSFKGIMSVKNVNALKSRLWIEFTGEQAYDYGGLSREWFFLVSREIFNPYYGLFEYSAIDNYTLQINNQSGMANSNHLQYFHFLGRVMGMAAYHGKLLDGFFIQPLYKLMLNRPITLDDMESVDLEYYNSLKWIMDNDIQNADLDLTFSVDVERYGQMLEVDLKPNGKMIKVTNENKTEYIRLVIKWRFEDSIQKQLSALMKGFTDIVPQTEIMIFDEHELELLLCGVQDIDVNDWKANTNYKGGYNANHPTIIHFWRMVYSLDNEGRARLLQFTTGTSRVPVNGFAELYGSNGPLKFCIEKVGTPDKLPRSHTCFNRLDLPPYETYEELRQKVLMALESTEGFGGVD